MLVPAEAGALPPHGHGPRLTGRIRPPRQRGCVQETYIDLHGRVGPTQLAIPPETGPGYQKQAKRPALMLWLG